ncbi:MAG TPA: YicC family protein [Bacteroidetes bacterium]|nr:YicC family protein [Bacteroidota bacterium]
MIQSMTGYGKAIKDFPDRQITVEIKSLNSKQVDISTRLPAAYRNKDIIIRKILTEKLVRGKIDLSMTVLDFTGETYPAVNKTAVKHYLRQLRDMAKELDIRSEEPLIQSLLHWPEVLADTFLEINETEWQQIVQTVEEAIAKVTRFREQEGSSIKKDMQTHVYSILDLLEQVSPFENERIQTIRNRLEKNLHELGGINTNDRERFEQEIAYYLDKLDINEEKIRLAHHCEYFLETMNNGSNIGKKLGFIVQEMGREINTLGSKANHTNIQKLVVMMKDELEKIKEQTFNVL